VKAVWVLQGVSGAGKTFVATSLVESERRSGRSARRVSADDFFITRSGRYVFTRAGLPAAHEACMRAFRSALKMGTELVVVDNTAIRPSEVERYLQVARKAGYEARVIRVECSPAQAAGRARAGVTLEQIQAQAVALGRRPAPASWGLVRMKSPGHAVVSWTAVRRTARRRQARS
jgi:predicted kinase